MYRVIVLSPFRGIKLQCTRMAVRANMGQSPNYVYMLGQRRIQLPGIEPAIGCDAGPTLNRYWVGRPTSWRTLAMVVEWIGLNVKDIFVSLVLSIIISWTFRILAHEERRGLLIIYNCFCSCFFLYVSTINFCRKSNTFVFDLYLTVLWCKNQNGAITSV